MAAELFKQNAGVNMLHVPYRTSPEALASLLSKNIDVLFDTVTALQGQVQSGQVSALAVTGKDRFPAVPNVPAVSESGVVPNYDVTTWYGLFGPKGMPAPVIAKLNKSLNEMLEEAADARAAGQGRRGGEGLDAAGVAAVHDRRIQEMERGAREGGTRAALTEKAIGPPARRGTRGRADHSDVAYSGFSPASCAASFEFSYSLAM